MKKVLLSSLIMVLLFAFVACESEPKGKTVTVTFKANYEGSTQEDVKQSMPADTKTKLKANTFEREGYTFGWWDTKADGSGHAYGEDAEISTSEDVVLYAQWIEKPVITFKSNYTGSEQEDYTQTVESGVEAKLDSNTFTRTQYNFVGWDTKADGTGTAYKDKDSIKTSESLSLFAQWEDELANTKWLCEQTVDVYDVVIGIIADNKGGVYFSECAFDTNDELVYGYSAYCDYKVSMDDANKKNITITFPDEVDAYEFVYEIDEEGNLICDDGDIQYTLAPKEDTVTITFKPSSSSEDVKTQILITGAKTALNPNSFSVENKAFYGWQDSNKAYADEAVVDFSEDKTLVAKWDDDFTTNTKWRTGDSSLKVAFDDKNGFSITGLVTMSGTYSLFNDGTDSYIIFAIHPEPLIAIKTQCGYTSETATSFNIDLAPFHPSYGVVNFVPDET